MRPRGLNQASQASSLQGSRSLGQASKPCKARGAMAEASRLHQGSQAMGQPWQTHKSHGKTAMGQQQKQDLVVWLDSNVSSRYNAC
jgi:uncharacterized protein YfaQ (DUF2300 family)